MKAFDEAKYLHRVNTFPFIRLMGMRLLSSAGGRSVMECRIRRILKNTAGTLHGGVVGALVDMSVATALRPLLPLHTWMTTVEYKVNFLKPVPEGKVTAHGTVLRRGKTIAAGTAEIRNGDGEVVAFGSATYYILKMRPPADAPAIMNGKKGRGGKTR